MHVRDLPEAARSFVSDAYCKARHWVGKADEAIVHAAGIYSVATPLVAAAMDAAGAAPETKVAAKTAKKVIDKSLVNYAKARRIGKAGAKIADIALS